jgi:hypothetical protein
MKGVVKWQLSGHELKPGCCEEVAVGERLQLGKVALYSKYT